MRALQGISLVQRWDPRVKTVSLGLLLVTAVSLNRVFTLALMLGVALILAALAGISFTQLLKRLAWLLPFGGFLVLVYPVITPGRTCFELTAAGITLGLTVEGVFRGTVLVTRLTNALVILLVLTHSTGLSNLLKALQDLRIPGIFLRLAEFTFRYMHVTVEELRRMLRAQQSRRFVPGRNLLDGHTRRILGQTVGMLFLRSYRRGENVYMAMLSRGYTGEAVVLTDFRVRASDFVLALAAAGVSSLVFLMDRGVLG